MGYGLCSIISNTKQTRKDLPRLRMISKISSDLGESIVDQSSSIRSNHLNTCSESGVLTIGNDYGSSTSLLPPGLRPRTGPIK